jgi:hypothetical protein
VGSPAAGVTSLAHLGKILVLGYNIAGCPYFFVLIVPNQFRYLVWGKEHGSFTHLLRNDYAIRRSITQLE